MSRVAAGLRTVLTAGALGFRMEANWIPLWAFVLFSLARPIATSLIIVVMYEVAGGPSQAGGPAALAYMFTGNAFFIFVGNVLFGTSQVVIEDREHYQMLKYIYSAPVSIYAFLLGRGLTKVVLATAAVAITLGFGFAAGLVPLDRAAFAPGLLLAATALGVGGLVFLGILLAGFTLNTARHATMLSEGIAGLLYLFSGAVFPPALLPRPLFAIAEVLPLTYWIELSRRAILGRSPVATGLAPLSDAALLALLAATTILFGAASVLGYRALERRARSRGLIDQVTSY
jgi:ABC-2 type transport system permease protein